MAGWVKLHRSILNWEWYDDINTFRLFIHLMLTVNHETKHWHGVEVKEGSVITSHSKLAGQARMTVKQVRTSIDKLKATGEVAVKTTNKYSIVTLLKWADYQSSCTDEGEQDGRQTDSQRAGKGQAKGKQRATTKEYKEGKNDKNERKKNIEFFETFTDNPVLKQALYDFNDMRKKMKSPMTDKAIELLLGKLTKLSTDEDMQIRILNEATMNNWKSVYALKSNSGKGDKVFTEQTYDINMYDKL